MAQTSPVTARDEWAQVVADYAGPLEPEHRRQHPRHPLNGPAQLAFTAKDGDRDVPTVRPCTVLDISLSGLMLRTRTRLSEGELILVQIRHRDRPITLCGRVAHCTQTVGAHKIGVALEFPE